jgi:predicted PurR-regulated permease PerM
LTALVFALALLFLYAAWRAIITFLFAIFFAYLLEAPVSRLQRWLKGSRGWAIAVVYLILIAGLVILFSLAGEQVVQQADKLMQQAPQWSAQISSGQIVQQVGAKRGWSDFTINKITSFLQNHHGEIVAATQNFIFRAFRTVQNIWWLVLVPILAIFFLKDGHRMAEQVVNSVENTRTRRLVAETLGEMNLMLGHYLRAQITLAALAMVVITFFLSVVFRVPYALALGPAAGALEFIPVVGPLVGICMIVGVAILSGYGHVFWVFLFLLIWRGIQDYVSSPRIMGSTLELHPLMVLFGVLAGGEVAGVIGVFLSIPVLATLRILWHAWLLQRKQTVISH